MVKKKRFSPLIFFPFAYHSQLHLQFRSSRLHLVCVIVRLSCVIICSTPLLFLCCQLACVFRGISFRPKHPLLLRFYCCCRLIICTTVGFFFQIQSPKTWEDFSLTRNSSLRLIGRPTILVTCSDKKNAQGKPTHVRLAIKKEPY